MSDKNFAYMIEQCLGNEEKLSAWETGFLDSISDGFGRDGYLTEAQAEKLEEIYGRIS